MNRLTLAFTLMNHKVDSVLDTVLLKAMSGGIKSVSSVGYYIDVTFRDGSSVSAWNANRYYSWLNKGVFTFPKKEDGTYVWQGARPRRSTMLKLYKMLGYI